MKKNFMLYAALGIFCTSISVQVVHAQWSLTGNANATSGSKLGSTSNVPVRLFTNDSERVRITQTGKVGIGTSAPLNLLTVQLNGGAPAASWLGGGSPPVFLGFAEEKSTGFNLATAGTAGGLRPVLNTRRSRGTLSAPLAVHDNDYLASFVSSGYDGGDFQNPATIDFYVDGPPFAGNVPGRISFVTGSNVGNRLERLKVGSTGDVSVVSGNLIMASAAKTIQFATPVANSTAMMTMFPSGTQNPDRMVISHSPLYPTWGLQYQDGADKFNFLAGGTPVLTADLGTQRVGIGTPTPAARLQVVADASATTPVISATGTYVGSSDVRGVQAVSKPADGWGYGVDATGGFIGGYFVGSAGAYASTGYGVFGSATGSAGTRIGVYGIASGGTVNNWGGYFPTKTYTSELRVGGALGATGYVAAINGKLIATEVRVELVANWPDYVFKKDYKLMPIEKLEASITAENHLPGVPAASEMKEGGIMLGAMQTKTMEKLEENTLYIIQLNNKIKLLETEKQAETALLNDKIQLLEQKIDQLAKQRK